MWVYSKGKYVCLVVVKYEFYGGDTVIGDAIFTICMWSAIGGAVATAFNTQGFEFVNPMWIYNRYNVNIIGVLVLTIIINLICPIGSIIYWFYKLCTIGRRR